MRSRFFYRHGPVVCVVALSGRIWRSVDADEFDVRVLPFAREVRGVLMSDHLQKVGSF
jgi:hypothetical protein